MGRFVINTASSMWWHRPVQGSMQVYRVPGATPVPGLKNSAMSTLCMGWRCLGSFWGCVVLQVLGAPQEQGSRFAHNAAVLLLCHSGPVMAWRRWAVPLPDGDCWCCSVGI